MPTRLLHQSLELWSKKYYLNGKARPASIYGSDSWELQIGRTFFYQGVKACICFSVHLTSLLAQWEAASIAPRSACLPFSLTWACDSSSWSWRMTSPETNDDVIKSICWRHTKNKIWRNQDKITWKTKWRETQNDYICNNEKNMIIKM